MSSMIPSLSSSPPNAATGEAISPVAGAPKQAVSSVEGGQVDSVILSEDAQSVAKLFAEAQQARGIDQKAVDRIKRKLAEGSYNVSAHDLANAIVTVLKEMSV